MGEHSKIEWCDHTFNPWYGCTKVSPACDNCYAEAWAKRSGLVKWGAGEPRRLTTDANWRKPLQWNKRAAANGVRERVFCASLADVFDEEVPDLWRWMLGDLIAATPHLDWLLLTKRPHVAKRYFQEVKSRLLPNIWLGVTVENQKMADLRIPILMEIPAPVRFLSMEPLLGPVDLERGGFTPLRPIKSPAGKQYPGISWVIVGGESGHGARPMQAEWVLSLRDQCAAAGVPFFFKQWGEWAPGYDYKRSIEMLRVGKKTAGRLLDGLEHSAFPDAGECGP